MAQYGLFISCRSFAVHLKRDFKFQVYRNYTPVSFKQNETPTENTVPESFKDEPEASGSQKENELEELRTSILKTSLTFVPEYGWNEKSLALGAKSLGISAAAHSLITGGGSSLVHYFNRSCNMELENYLKELSSKSEKVDLSVFLTEALENRLRMIIPYLSRWPEALALVSFPTQIPVHTKNVLDLVDSIWHFYGDKSVDLTWYSKRLILATAYKAAELSLIQDKSDDFSNTFAFLQRRIEDVIETENFIHMVSENGKHFLEFGSGAFLTARNLLGLNSWFR